MIDLTEIQPRSDYSLVTRQPLPPEKLDAPTCPKCGNVTVRNRACYKCINCGESLGCS